MSVLSRLEGALAAFFEGGAGRLFGARLQPVEVARVLERAMLDHKVVAPDSVVVPNRFEARLNPTDYAGLAALSGTVEREAAALLDRKVRAAGLRAVAPIVVELVPDPTVRRLTVRPAVAFDESIPPTVAGTLDRTRRLRPLRPGPRAVSEVLVDEHGREKPLDGRAVMIGRALENDLVIRDIRVSRHHAVLDPVGSGWRIRDLQSTNGTFVEGRRVDETLVDAGCELSLGGYRLFLRRG